MTPPSADAGEFLRRLHWQCWRADAPPLEIDLPDLVAVLPMLIESGSVGLIWPRLRVQAQRYGAIATALEQAYQSQVEHNALVEREITRVVSRLHHAEINPVLINGYALARLYPGGLSGRRGISTWWSRMGITSGRKRCSAVPRVTLPGPSFRFMRTSRPSRR